MKVCIFKFITPSMLAIVFIVSCTPTSIAGDSVTTPTATKSPFNEILTSTFSSTQFGVSFLIPDGWQVDENETGITVAANPALRTENNLSFAEGEAIILLRTTDRTDNQPYDEGTMIDMLNDLPPYLPPGKERAHIITLNGKTIAFAGYGINKPIPYPSFTAMTLLEEKVVLGLIFTSIPNERSFRGLFQDMIASMESIDVPQIQ